MGTIINRVCAVAAMAIAVLLGVSNAAAQGDCDGWVPLHDFSPRDRPMLVSQGATAILFGGSNWGGANSDPRSTNPDTWLFNGSSWQFVTMNGPRPASEGACSFDVDRQAFIIHGGNVDVYAPPDYLPLSDETWEFRAGAWRQVQSPMHPPKMMGHAMGFDPIRHVTLLPSGHDLWIYDGIGWQKVVTTSAPPMGHRNLLYDRRDQSMVAVPLSGPAWRLSWTGTTYIWTQIANPGVQVSSVFYDESLQTIILLSPQGRFYTFSGSGPATQLPIEPPIVGIYDQGAFWPVCVPIDAGWLVVVNAAQNGQVASYIVTSAGWTPIAGRASPNATDRVALAFDESSHSAVMFGGMIGGTNTPLDETWTLRGEHWSQVEASGPPARIDASIGFVPTRGVTILVGGSPTVHSPGWGEYLSRMWLWQNGSWRSLPFPAGLAASISRPMNLAFDPSMQMSLLGTSNGLVGIGVDEVIAVDVGGIAPAPYQLVYDGVRQRILDIGGGGVRALTASDSGRIWVPMTGLDSLSNSSRAVYDPDRAAVVRCGGPQQHQVTTFFPSIGSVWQTLPVEYRAPFGRIDPAVIYDPVARRVVMYGGRPHTATWLPLRETWKLARGPAAVALEPVDTYVEPGQTAEVFIIASGGGVIQYQWFKDGVALTNSDRISGADSDTLQIQNFTSDDNAEYHVTVHNPCGNDQSVAVQVRAIPACPGDFDDSGATDANDIAAFITAYEHGLMIADVDRSGGIDALDLAAFFASFEAGGC